MKLEIFTWGFTLPKKTSYASWKSQLQHLLAYVCSQGKRVEFCLPCSWTRNMVGGELGWKVSAEWTVDPVIGAGVTEQQDSLCGLMLYQEHVIVLFRTYLVVGIVLGNYINKILPPGSKNVFTNGADLVPAYWLSSRKQKLSSYRDFSMQFCSGPDQLHLLSVYVRSCCVWPLRWLHFDGRVLNKFCWGLSR